MTPFLMLELPGVTPVRKRRAEVERHRQGGLSKAAAFGLTEADYRSAWVQAAMSTLERNRPPSRWAYDDELRAAAAKAKEEGEPPPAGKGEGRARLSNLIPKVARLADAFPWERTGFTATQQTIARLLGLGRDPGKPRKRPEERKDKTPDPPGTRQVRTFVRQLQSVRLARVEHRHKRDQHDAESGESRAAIIFFEIPDEELVRLGQLKQEWLAKQPRAQAPAPPSEETSPPSQPPRPPRRAAASTSRPAAESIPPLSDEDARALQDLIDLHAAAHEAKYREGDRYDPKGAGTIHPSRHAAIAKELRSLAHRTQQAGLARGFDLSLDKVRRYLTGRIVERYMASRRDWPLRNKHPIGGYWGDEGQHRDLVKFGAAAVDELLALMETGALPPHVDLKCDPAPAATGNDALEPGAENVLEDFDESPPPLDAIDGAAAAVHAELLDADPEEQEELERLRDLQAARAGMKSLIATIPDDRGYEAPRRRPGELIASASAASSGEPLPSGSRAAAPRLAESAAAPEGSEDFGQRITDSAEPIPPAPAKPP